LSLFHNILSQKRSTLSCSDILRENAFAKIESFSEKRKKSQSIILLIIDCLSSSRLSINAKIIVVFGMPSLAAKLMHHVPVNFLMLGRAIKSLATEAATFLGLLLTYSTILHRLKAHLIIPNSNEQLSVRTHAITCRKIQYSDKISPRAN
jgi:hypothetical protein